MQTFHFLVGFTAGNFIWQLFSKKDWKRAADISFFQIAAVIAYNLFTA